MKNEPVVTYNHMQDDSASGETSSHPISLYMIFAVDILLMCGIAFLALQLLF
jgi:hypothetical protein